MYTDLSIHETLNFQGAFLYNGGIRRLQRHGLKADGIHGKVDSKLQLDSNHKLQHKHDNNGKKNR